MSDQAVDAFASVEQTLAAVEKHLQVFKQDGLESVVAELSPLEKAKVQVSLGTKALVLIVWSSSCGAVNMMLTGCSFAMLCLCVRVCAAYSVNALLYVFLKTQGVSTKDIRQTHVKQELVRCLFSHVWQHDDLY